MADVGVVMDQTKPHKIIISRPEGICCFSIPSVQFSRASDTTDLHIPILYDASINISKRFEERDQLLLQVWSQMVEAMDNVCSFTAMALNRVR